MTQPRFEDVATPPTHPNPVPPVTPDPKVTNPEESPGDPVTPPTSTDEIDFSTLKPDDFGGDRFDILGNLIKDGKVIKSKQEVLTAAKEKAEKPVTEEEEIKVSLDKDGNLVNDKNEIVYKKGTFNLKEDGTIEELESTDSLIKPLVEKFTTLGYDFKDEDGNVLEFEDSEDGLLELANHIGQQNADATINNWLENNPEINKIYNFIQNGKTIEDYLEYRKEYGDYTKMIFPEDEDAQEKILTDYYRKFTALNANEIKELVDYAKDSNKLKEKAEAGLTALKTKQIEEEAEIVKSRKEREEADEKARRENLTNINKIITSGKISKVQIPDKEKAAFFEYLTKPLENGQTRAVSDYSKLPLEEKLLLEYLMFTGLNLDRLTSIKKEEIKADLIKNRLANSKKIVVVKSPSSQKGSGKLPDFASIT